MPESKFHQMREMRFLVIGATGHVGSKIARILAEKGYNVTAMVRQAGATIEDPYNGTIKYVIGDFFDEPSLRRALPGIDVVISSANGIIPQRTADNASSVNEGALRLISLCEKLGVKRFVQSSVPTFKGDSWVPELAGKRRIEARLRNSTMQSIVVRNAAFMDVFLVMGGFGAVEDRSRHATTKRNYGFTKIYMKFIGGLVENYGLMLAPGGGDHGTPIIATRDVAEMIVGAALYEGDDNLLIEASGPEWLTWRQIADIVGMKTGRKIRIIALPAWLARLTQLLVSPFSKSAANIFALMGFVASFQPRWESEQIVKRFNLPKQMTVSDYIDANYIARK